jgi:TetR/AcrR family transcriptional repressor of mexJK operon
MSQVDTKPLRAGSAVKRSAILLAARQLFMAEGFERTSVDAIAAAAGVSKRTIYDYFGDKNTLLLRVIESSAAGLLSSVKVAAEELLGPVAESPSTLEASLIGFVEHISDTAMGSDDYSSLRRLVMTESAHLPVLRDHWDTREPESLLAEHFAAFERAGLLRVPKPMTAADHFGTLTFRLLQDEADGSPARRHEIVVDGVQAFLRAYAP